MNQAITYMLGLVMVSWAATGEGWTVTKGRQAVEDRSMNRNGVFHFVPQSDHDFEDGIIVIGDDDDDDDHNPDLPEYVEIASATHAGTGCPAGSADITYLEDGRTFNIAMPDLYAALGDGIGLGESRKACQIMLEIEHSAGWQFALQDVSAEVAVELAGESQGLIKATTYFQGDIDTVDVEESVYGPTQQTILFTKGIEQPVWSSCDESRAFNFKLQLRLNGAGHRSEAFMSLAQPATIRIAWRRCG